MNKFTSKVAAAALAVTLASVSGQALAADSTKPIIIPEHNWASQVVMAHVIGLMFESMGKMSSTCLLTLKESMRRFVTVM